MEKISVIVPVLNTAEHLNRIIMGLLKQSYKDLEIIIIDSGSKDETLEICNNWSFLDDRIKIYETKSSIFELALEKSTGKYILFIDNINLEDEKMLEKMINAIKNNNSDISIYNSNYNKVASYLVCNHQNIINTFDGPLWNKLFKKDLFNTYNMENIFKTALKKAVRVSLFV